MGSFLDIMFVMAERCQDKSIFDNSIKEMRTMNSQNACWNSATDARSFLEKKRGKSSLLCEQPGSFNFRLLFWRCHRHTFGALGSFLISTLGIRFCGVCETAVNEEGSWGWDHLFSLFSEKKTNPCV
ncbi:hypothetical protein TNCV_3252121 [Trichonephila clavipes]|nr:hypothetical protein TNCV_3252121 [Trichonephila clavipes]